MTDDALDRACEAAWDVWRNMTGERWDDLSDKQKDEARLEYSAALLVMAKDIRFILQDSVLDIHPAKFEIPYLAAIDEIIGNYVGEFNLYE